MLVAIGCGLGWSFGDYLYGLIAGDGKSVVLGYLADAAFWVAAATVAGLSLGVVLLIARRSLPAVAVVVLALGWAAASVLGWGLTALIDYTVGWWPLSRWLGAALAGVLGGLVSSGVLALLGRWRLQVLPLVLIAAGWAVALDATVLVDGWLGWSANRFMLGLIAGLIGGAATFWALGGLTRSQTQ